MLLLTSTSDKVQVITGSSGTIKVHASYVDNASGTITPTRTNTASISTNTTTDVVAAPASSTQRNVKHLSVRNTHASVTNAITVQHTDGTTVEELWVGTLLAGESVVFDQYGGWTMYAANGNPKQAVTAFQSITPVNALSISSNTVTIDLSLGDYFTLTLTANVTTITIINAPASGKAMTFMVRFLQDGTGSRTVAWPSAFKALGGSDTAVQSAANAYTILSATTFDQGTRWEYALHSGAA